MRVGVENPEAIACHRLLPSKIALLESPLFCATFAIFRRFGGRVRPISAAFDKCIPGLHTAGLKGGHEVPQRSPRDVVGETGIPGDRDAERQMLVEIEIAAELAFIKENGPVTAARAALISSTEWGDSN